MPVPANIKNSDVVWHQMPNSQYPVCLLLDKNDNQRILKYWWFQKPILAGYSVQRVFASWDTVAWKYSIVDIIHAITESNQPSRYWTDQKTRARKKKHRPAFFRTRVEYFPVYDSIRWFLAEVCSAQYLWELFDLIPFRSRKSLNLLLWEKQLDLWKEENSPKTEIERHLRYSGFFF